MKNVFGKIGLTIVSLFVYGLINQNPKDISGIILTIILVVVIIAIWKKSTSKI